MFKLLAVLILTCNICDSARILVVIPSPAYSHQIVYKPLWKELSNRGHEVVLITSHPDYDPCSNVTEIDVSGAYNIWEYYLMKLSQYHDAMNVGRIIKQLSTEVSKYDIEVPKVQQLLNNRTEYFDLVIIEIFYVGLFGFAERFKCPLIGVVSYDLHNHMYSFFGSPVHPIAYPDILSGYHMDTMDFWQRLGSVFNLPLHHFQMLLSYDLEKEDNEMNEKYFGTKLSYVEIMKKISIVFVNIAPTLNTRPVGPAIIKVGGYLHIHPEKKPAKEYQDFLDSARNGAIYFSLGTNVKSHVVPPEMRQAFLDAFRDLSYKVLWKFDIVDLPNVPENVKIVEWAPQQDILRHPNIKLFIFQGGLQSYEEAVYNKIPLVGIPFLGDQDSNVERLVGSGYGVKIDKHNVTKESVIEAIHEVINNPSYKQKITETSELIADQPMTGLEKAVWWTEYVLRHKGAHHLRSPVMDLPFYQYYLLDVLGFLLGCIILAIVVVYKLCKLIGRLLFKTKAKKVKVK